MVLVKKRISKVNEQDEQQSTVSLSNPELVQMHAQAQQKKANAKKAWDNACQEYENTVAQLLAKQAELNKQKAQTNNNQNMQENVNEGVNTKHLIIGEIIATVLKNIEVSYILSDKDIQRLSRKINDYFNSHKDDFELADFRIMIKRYFLGHSSINLAQREINEFTDEFINEISKKKYDKFSKYFADSSKSSYEVDLNDIENIDEFEGDLEDAGFEFDEDLDNNVLIITNKNKINNKRLHELIIQHSF